MRKVWAVVRREFLERVRTRWFVISTILGPVFMIAVIVLPALLATRGGAARRIALVDEEAATFGDRLATQLTGSGRFAVEIVRPRVEVLAAAYDSLTGLVQARQLDGYLVVTAATVESGIAEYRGRNVSSLQDMQVLETVLRQSLTVERLTRRGIDPAVVQEAQGRIDLRTLRITRRGTTGETGAATFFLAYVVGFVLYMAIVLYGVNVMRSVIEEKQSRIIEVLISSMKPFQLMLGKVIGVGGVGLLQFAIWGAAAAAMFRYRGALLRLFDVAPQVSAGIQLPAVGGGLVLLVTAYFLLGYLLYSAMFAVVGASVNTDAEAQQAQMPVMMLLIAAIIMFPVVLNDAGGKLAVGMAVVPFFSPIIMPIRYAAVDVPTDEVAMSLVVLAVTTLGVVWVASRIYRVGILMYGKRPSVKELARWAREG